MMYWVAERLDPPPQAPHAWDGDVGGKLPALRCIPVVLGSDWVPGTLWGRRVSLAGQQGLDSLTLDWCTSPPSSLHRNGPRNKPSPGHLPEKLFPLISEIGKLRYKFEKSLRSLQRPRKEKE